MRTSTDQASVSDNPKQSFLADGMLIVASIATANFLLHLYFNNRYGYFRDEFNYIACGDHLAWATWIILLLSHSWSKFPV